MARKFNDAIDLTFNELQNVVGQNLAADPGTGAVDGRFYYSTSLNAIRLRAGGSWTTLASGAGYTDEAAQDAIATAFAAGTHTGGLGITYDDVNNSLSLTLSNNEGLQDVLGAFLPSAAGSSGIAVTYDDVGNKMNYVVGGVAPAAITFAATSRLLGRQTAAGGPGEELTVTGGLEFATGTIQRSALTGDVTALAGSNATTIATNAVTTAKILDANVNNAKLANMAALTVKGNNTGAPGVPLDLTVAQTKTLLAIANTDVSGLGSLSTVSNLTGNVTSVGAATTIAAGVVTNAMLANMAASSFKGNNTGSSAAAIDLTVAQAKTLLAIANTDVSGLGSLSTVSNLTGNVTSVGAVTTIAAGIVTNAMHANMAALTVKGNNTGGASAPIDLTTAQAKTLLAIVPADVTGFDTQVRTSTLNQMTAPTADLSINTHKLTNLVDPTNPQDAATKNYVDAVVNAQVWKDPVDAATTAALPALTYNSGTGTLTETANAALAAQDGVTLAVGDSLLVKDQASSFQNGIYTVTAVGSGAAPFVLTRRADADAAAELRDAAVMIEGGTTQGGDVYTQTTSTLADLTAATQTWVKTADTNTVYTADGTTVELVGNSFRIAAGAAGNGLSGGGGSALAVNVSTGLEINTDNVRLAAAGAGTGLTGGAGANLAVNPGTSLELSGNTVRLAAAAAGNGLTGGGAAALSIDHTKVPLLFVGNITGGATSEVITHNLGTRDVMVLIYLAAGTFAEEDFTVEHTSINTVTIRSGTTIPATTYRAVCFG